MQERNLIYQELQDSTSELEENAGGLTMLYPYPNGRYVPVIVDTENQGLTLEVGGKAEEIQLSVFARMNALTTQTGDSALNPTGDDNSGGNTGDSNLFQPQIGHHALLNQKLYRIIGRDVNHGAGVWVIHFGSPDARKR